MLLPLHPPSEGQPSWTLSVGDGRGEEGRGRGEEVEGREREREEEEIYEVKVSEVKMWQCK